MGLLLACALAQTPAAAASLAQGRQIAEHGLGTAVPACSSCHGAHFAGDPAQGAPPLAGQDAATLMDDLYALASNPKDQRPMAAIARHLDMAARAGVTIWLSELPKPSR